MSFQKAQTKQARLKVGLYGPPGSGKTFTALLMAEGLAKAENKRIAYVDTERGTDFYAQAVPTRAVHPEAFDFDALYTRSLSDVTEDVKGLDPATHGVVVLDSISHLWDAAIEAYQGKRTSIDTIPFNAWAKIKKPYKELIRFLLDSSFHVFILGRQKNIFEDVDGETKKVGVGMRAEGETEYEPHICFRMERRRNDPKGAVYAVVEKDRSGVLAGQMLPNPSFATISPLLTLLGSEQAQSEDPDEIAARDSELLAKDEDKAKGKEEKSRTLLTDLTAAIHGAPDVKTLAAVATEIKKQRRYLLPEHQSAIQALYADRWNVLSKAAAPSEV